MPMVKVLVFFVGELLINGFLLLLFVYFGLLNLKKLGS